MNTNILNSFLLTLFVGLTMGFGSLFSFLLKDENKKFLSFSLSFSAGIMIYISFMEILPEGIHMIEETAGAKNGHIIGLTGFFGGMVLTALLEKLVHSMGGHHHHDIDESHANLKEKNDENMDKEHLKKMGIMTAVSIAIHNLPEGLVIFTTGLKDITLAIPLSIAVILHNIPLSIAISVPIYYATQSKKKAFLYASLVGLCQPLGAVLGYMILSNFFNDMVFGLLFCIISGVMIFVSLDELLPTSQQYADHHFSVYGTILGMIVMAVSLMLFGHSH